MATYKVYYLRVFGPNDERGEYIAKFDVINEQELLKRLRLTVQTAREARYKTGYWCKPTRVTRVICREEATTVPLEEFAS